MKYRKRIFYHRETPLHDVISSRYISRWLLEDYNCLLSVGNSSISPVRILRKVILEEYENHVNHLDFSRILHRDTKTHTYKKNIFSFKENFRSEYEQHGDIDVLFVEHRTLLEPRR